MKFLKILAVGSLMAVSGLNAFAMEAGSLKCEYRVNPLGVDTAKPRLSWVLEAPGRGIMQSAYQVRVATSPEKLAADEADLWDSGKVDSDQSTHVEYGGKPLTSNAACHWKVRTWDQDGKPGEWSEPALWTVGLLDASDWKATWIGKDEKSVESVQLLSGSNWIWYPRGNPAESAPSETIYFRRSFDVAADRPIKRAVAQVAGDNSYEFYINGLKVTQGGSFVSAANIDVTSFLTPGKNLLSAAGINGGSPDNPAGFIATVKIEYESGEPQTVVTDGEWLVVDRAIPGWELPTYHDAGWVKAMVTAEFGKGPWGEPKAMESERRLPARMLRKEFKAEKEVKRATAYVCGLGLFELYLNGGKISDHVMQPSLTDYEKHARYVTFDVTDQVKAGDNAMGVWLGNGRYFAPRLGEPMLTRTYGYPKLLLQLELEYADGTRDQVVSDETWKLTTNGPIVANNEYDGEEYDARLEMAGWDQPGFDAASWENAHKVESIEGTLKSESIEPMRVVETLKPVAITEPKPGTFIVDLGQNMVGWCRITATGTSGTKIKLRHAETLTTDGLLYLDNIRGAKVTDVYTLKGDGEEIYEPRFTYHGFRYVEVTGWPGTPTAANIEGRVVHDDMAPGGKFTSSNELLNRIYKNIVWGTRGNYRTIPTDCPQRDERQAWLGDRSEECRGESYLFDVSAFYAKWVRDIHDSQKPTGSVPDVAPNYWELYQDGVVWPSSFVIIPHTMHTQYGDKRILAEHYDGMKLWIDYMSKAITADDIITSNTYGDWCVPPEDPKLIHSGDPKRKTDPALVSSAYFYHDTTVMAKVARLLGKSDDAKQFDALALRLKNGFNKRFFKADESVYDNGTQTAAVLPLAFGLVPDEHKTKLFKRLTDKIEKETHGHIGTGLVGGQWLMRVLSDNGRPDLAYTIATKTTYPSWGYMVEKGATTIWELWNGDTADPAMNSGNHVMLIGDLNIWFTEYLAGIRPVAEAPGFKKFTIRPYVIEGLNSASGEVESPYGKIASSWIREGTGLSFSATIPHNTSALISLPAKSADQVTEGGKPVNERSTLKFVKQENGLAIFEAGSGKYEFQVK